MPLVDVELVGAWWTFDAPTLRLHSGGGRYVPLWSVGEGESAVLVPPAGADHGWFVPHLPHLAGDHVVHAVDHVATADTAGLIADLVTAVDATGSRILAAPAELAPIAADVARRTGVRVVVLDPDDPRLPRPDTDPEAVS